jgi:hypothetical protein
MPNEDGYRNPTHKEVVTFLEGHQHLIKNVGTVWADPNLIPFIAGEVWGPCEVKKVRAVVSEITQCSAGSDGKKARCYYRWGEAKLYEDPGAKGPALYSHLTLVPDGKSNQQ